MLFMQGGAKKMKGINKQKSKIFGHTNKVRMKQKAGVIALAVLLVVAVGYIGVDKYQENRSQQMLAVYQRGIQLGYQQAIVQIVQQAVTCQEVPLIVQNQTINMIAVECLQRQEAQESQG
jgi:hypothetical protein